MIKLLSAIVMPPHMSVSGAARAAEHLSAALSPHCDVTVASMLNGHDETKTSESGEVKRVSVHTRLSPFLRWRKLPNRYKTLFYKSDVPDIIRKGNFDIVHLHNPLPALEMERVAHACRSRGIPYVISTHGFNEIANGIEVYQFGVLRQMIWRTLVLQPVKRVVSNAAAVFALSPADVPIVRNMGYTRSDLPIIYNGVIPPPADTGDDVAILTRLGVPPRNPAQITCMFLANHTPNKGLPILFEAFARLQCPYLLIVGGEKRDGIAYNHYLCSCRRGQQIIVTGKLEDKEVAALFRRADIFVFPTLADTFPLVILEAMSYGKAIVASRVGGIPYQLADNCGVLVPPRDAAQLASVIETLTRQSERLIEMGRNARARVAAEFTWKRSAEQAFSSYQKVLETGSPRQNA